MGSEYIYSSSECCDLALSHMNRKARPLTSERAFYLVCPQGSNPGQTDYDSVEPTH